MAHDVFISYATADLTVAHMVCATLEKQGIRCWMAPRDIQPGDDWGGAIVEAIKGSRAMVLVFSGAANDSRHIPRELERAIGREIPLVPVRIENVEPRGSLRYSLSSVHWLDAITPPVEAHIVRLADRLRTMLHLSPPSQTGPPIPVPVIESNEPVAAVPIPALPVTPAPKAVTTPRSWRGFMLAGAGIAGIIVLAIVLSNQQSAPVSPGLGSSPSPTVSPTGSPASSPTPDSPVVRPPDQRPDTSTSGPPPPAASAGGFRVNPNVKWREFPTHIVDRTPVAPQVLRQLENAAYANPADDRPLIKLGDIYYDGREYGGAISYYRHALDIRPTNSAIRIDLAMAYWCSDHDAEAESHLIQVLKAEPGNPWALVNLGIVYAASNHLKAAADVWQELIEDQPGTPQAARAREMMTWIRAR